MSQTSSPKIILITGTSSGFGLLSALKLAQAGHAVYASMRDLSKKDDLEWQAQKLGITLNICQCDVTKSSEVNALITTIMAKHGRIDAVVNNAGIAVGGFFEDLDALQIRSCMETNFWGVVNTCQELVPIMRRQKSGTIINISSIAGRTASPSLSAYNASKWALEGFSESLYYEIKRFGVHVVLVEPGSYPTQIFKKNAILAKRAQDPKSPYFGYTQKLEGFVSNFHAKSKRDPNQVVDLILRIVEHQNPKLRYVSDFSSWVRVITSKILPPSFYRFIYERVIYGKTTNAI